MSIFDFANDLLLFYFRNELLLFRSCYRFVTFFTNDKLLFNFIIDLLLFIFRFYFLKLMLLNPGLKPLPCIFHLLFYKNRKLFVLFCLVSDLLLFQFCESYDFFKDRLNRFLTLKTSFMEFSSSQ